jgi:hypothetical protein
VIRASRSLGPRDGVDSTLGSSLILLGVTGSGFVSAVEVWVKTGVEGGGDSGSYPGAPSDGVVIWVEPMDAVLGQSPAEGELEGDAECGVRDCWAVPELVRFSISSLESVSLGSFVELPKLEAGRGGDKTSICCFLDL